MDIEKLSIKKRILTGVFSGLIYSLVMAGFDYYTNEPFSLLKFIFHFVFFGLFMGIALRYTNKKK
ncbi:hypothetical protein [Lacinutrix venerupis]|uniref:Uncharacterized protein n=1 Tax=Lacinutrix venerupis TaxID=1486034 RepID=A0AAC9PX63_9FLAO|nr:hypothetical protein [Lacinutrix venerupis]APY00234.1 hypothetical protein BWR22_07875 [Lacinutrix venerupis]